MYATASLHGSRSAAEYSVAFHAIAWSPLKTRLYTKGLGCIVLYVSGFKRGEQLSDKEICPSERVFSRGHVRSVHFSRPHVRTLITLGFIHSCVVT